MKERESLMSDCEIKEKIKQILFEKLNIDANDDSFIKSLTDVGLNSLLFVKLLINIESAFDIEFEEEFISMNNINCLDQLAVHIKKLMDEQ